jgi:hypothetical protein
MKEVLSACATDIVATHHWKHAEIHVHFLVESDYGLNNVPDAARESVQDGLRPGLEPWKIAE